MMAKCLYFFSNHPLPLATQHSAVEWPTIATHMVIPTCSPYPVLCRSEMWKWSQMASLKKYMMCTKCHQLSWHSYAKPWFVLKKVKKEDRVSESMVALLQMYGSNNMGSGRVCVFVTWDPNIPFQGVENPDKISDIELLSNAWHSNHVFIHEPTARF
jgi:hypothetical protein